MSRYAIVASEGIYQGFNGIVDYAIVDSDNEEEVAAIGQEMSLQVMDDWSCVGDELSKRLRELYGAAPDDSCYDELYDRERESNIHYYYFKLCEEAEGQDSGLLNQELYSNEDKFRRTWAVEQIICKF